MRNILWQWMLTTDTGHTNIASFTSLAESVISTIKVLAFLDSIMSREKTMNFQTLISTYLELIL